MSRLAAVALVAALCGAAGTAEAGDPLRHWWTIETDHFVIHYYDPLGDAARRLAVVAEHAHKLLAPALDNDPAQKTQITLVDDTDGANGFASVLPYDHITLFATAPIGESALNDHDDWLYGLVAHEYTHIVHLDTIGGLPKRLNDVLGKTWSPNQVMPRWLIEGLAVYEESKRSSSGRIRSNTFDMYLRAAVLHHEQLDLDAVTSGPLQFPRGNAAYLYGSRFLQYIFDRFGDDKVAKMSHYGGTYPIPFSINRQIHETTGHSFDALWTDWNHYLRERYSTQLEAVERAGVRQGRRLTFDTEGHISPQYSADGKLLYWLANDGVSRIRLRAMPVGGNVGDAHDVVDGDRWGGWDVLSDGSIVYEQTQTFRNEYDFQDLFYRDTTKRVVRLTHGLRARDPEVSPDGRQVAFAMNGASHQRLAVMDLTPDAPPKILWSGARFDQSYNPTWSPDGKTIAFSAWRKGGLRDILMIDVASGTVTEVTHDRAIDGDPMFSKDGTTLYFSSDRTGIYNIYAYDLATRKLWQVTNVIGGAFDPAVSPDGKHLAYHGFDADGFDAGGTDLYELDLDRDHWTPARPYVDDRPPPTDIPDDEITVPAPREYRALETLGPHAWTASLDTASSLGTAVSVQTAGGDVAGLHAWSLGVTLALDSGIVNFGGAYGYGGSRIPLRVSGSRTLSVRNGYRIDGLPMPYSEETVSGSLSFGVPSRRSPNSTLSFAIDLDADNHRLVDIPPGANIPDPSEQVPRPPISNYFQTGVALRGGWATTRGYTELLGPTEGLEASGSLRYDDPAFGATYRNLTMSWSLRTFFKLPWGLTPVAVVRWSGGLRVGDIDRGDAYALGGAPDQDFASALVGTARVGSTGYLRGYDARVVSGDVYQLVNLEYRQRLWQIERGLSTLPVYFKRLHFAGLVDAGTAYDGDLALGDVKTSVGAALRLDLVLGYYASGTIEIGHARGLADKGIDETWLLLTSTL